MFAHNTPRVQVREMGFNYDVVGVVFVQGDRRTSDRVEWLEAWREAFGSNEAEDSRAAGG